VAGVWQDIRYAVRALRRAPGFTAVAVSVLAIGIGATGAMFSLVDAVLVRALPFRDPDRLVMLWEHPPNYEHNRVSPLNFLDWSEQQHAFTGMAAVSGGGRTLTGAGGSAERVPGQSVTAAFFDVLGIRAVLGRTFVPGDATLHPNVVVIGERFWRSRFGADRNVIGRSIMLDGELATVIGVVPATFQILYPSDLWMPYLPRRSAEQRRPHYMQVLARLKPGVGLAQARDDMSAIADGIAVIAPDTNRGWGVTIEPFRHALVGTEVRATTMLLAGVVAFVLLMACANVSNLLLARGLGRARELAVRAALGGSRSRIVRQLITESLLLASLGGAVGLAVVWSAVRAAPAFIPLGTLPESIAPAFDARVATFEFLLTIATGVLFGIAPAWHASRTPLAEAMSGSGGRATRRGAGALRAGLAVTGVAAAVLLLSGAGLLVRTLVALDHVDAGYHADHVLTMSVSLPLSRYPDVDRVLAFYQAAEREIAAVPGVRVAAIGGNLPLDGWDIGQGFEVVGHPAANKANPPVAHYQIVGAGYFRALGIPVLRGRAFTDHDTTSAQPVCIVNEEFVRRHMPDRDPVGALVNVAAMATNGPFSMVREIVGVIRQVRVNPGEEEPAVEIYVPVTQNAWYSASIAVQTSSAPAAFAAPVRAAIARVDKDQPINRVRTMEEVAADATARPRFRAQLVGAFAALALILSAVGLFGVVAFSVNQRTREFGIRVALGARSSDVLRLVLREAATMTALGVAAGLAVAVPLSRSLASLLFGVRPLDPATFLGAAGVLALTALAACAAPALRATRVDPVVALRQD
jgi:putative ABC transport system permease protein